MTLPVYGKLTKRSKCQHIIIGGGTLCDTREIAPHRLDYWSFSKGRGEFFKDRRICFNCDNILKRSLDPEITMKIAEAVYLGQTVTILRKTS